MTGVSPSQPRIEMLGDLLGAKVLINRTDQSIIIAHPDLPSITFPVDHPYIQGTKIEKSARAALQNTGGEK